MRHENFKLHLAGSIASSNTSLKTFFFENVLFLTLGFYLLFSILVTTSTYLKPTFSSKRQMLCILADTGIITFSMISTQEQGGILYGLFLWIIVGNGIRYGMRSILITQIMSIIGFLTVIALNPYWLSHNELSIGLLITLILVPLYLSRLLIRPDEV